MWKQDICHVLSVTFDALGDETNDFNEIMMLNSINQSINQSVV